MHRSLKFQVIHETRGALLPEDVFVLVPSRDPAAVRALRAYAEATMDPVLSAELVRWCDQVEGVLTLRPKVPAKGEVDLIRFWSDVLAREVRAERMTIETAFQRIAGHALVLAKLHPSVIAKMNETAQASQGNAK